MRANNKGLAAGASLQFARSFDAFHRAFCAIHRIAE
jgi:hypothetical protein